ncbi:heme-dependent oxidative N-demethylase subunit alpha family protein, partial [Acinetobacter baumannii]
LRFNLGMSWQEFHGPVPLAHEMKVFEKALKFLLRLRIGHPVRRLNWTLTVRPRLETSAETLHEWAPDRAIVTPENAGELVHLRVEL